VFEHGMAHGAWRAPLRWPLGANATREAGAGWASVRLRQVEYRAGQVRLV
jgi:hypothetical protein